MPNLLGTEFIGTYGIYSRFLCILRSLKINKNWDGIYSCSAYGSDVPIICQRGVSEQR